MSRYEDSAGNTIDENSGVFSLVRMAGCRWHAGSKILCQLL